MIRALLVAFGLLCASLAPALAQGCGPTNPNCVLVTAPNGDNTNKAASTAFVQNAFGGGSSLALASGKILIGQVSGFAVAQTPSGDLTLSNAGVFIVTKTNSVPFTVLATTSPGTGVATALGINVGSAGAFVAFNGALGTPSSGTATNLTGTAAGLTAGAVTTNANLTGPITSSGNATSVGSQTGTGSTFAMNTSPVFVTPTLGAATATSLAFSPSTGGIIGTTTNNNTNAGNVGEFISSTVATGSAVALTTNVAANVTSISLTAGDWDVSSEVYFNSPATTSFTTVLGSISTTTATLNQTAGFWDVKGFAAFVPGNNTGWVSCGVPFVRLSLAGTTTVFLVSFATFTVSTAAAWGTIQARRVR